MEALSVSVQPQSIESSDQVISESHPRCGQTTTRFRASVYRPPPGPTPDHKGWQDRAGVGLSQIDQSCRDLWRKVAFDPNSYPEGSNYKAIQYSPLQLPANREPGHQGTSGGLAPLDPYTKWS